jgi:hypothetical protein
MLNLVVLQSVTNPLKGFTQNAHALSPLNLNEEVVKINFEEIHVKNEIF